MNRGDRGGRGGEGMEEIREMGEKGVSPADVYVALVTGAAFVSICQLRRSGSLCSPSTGKKNACSIYLKGKCSKKV